LRQASLGKDLQAHDHAGAIEQQAAEPEDVLYAMLSPHRKDASNAFRQALQAFGVTWERNTKAPAQWPPGVLVAPEKFRGSFWQRTSRSKTACMSRFEAYN
jgi:hypothetical protein